MKISLFLACVVAAAVSMPAFVVGHNGYGHNTPAIVPAPATNLRVLSDAAPAPASEARADEDCDENLPEPADDCDQDLPEPTDDCDEDLPEPADDCDQDLPEPDCDDDLPIAGNDADEYGGDSDNIGFDALQRGGKYMPGKAHTN